ncbi:MAG TPA: hypothetical protein ENJ09_09480 [Planctomycetes bacterium]|nr:hypothetical protein [Planctomycetota bacterium]
MKLSKTLLGLFAALLALSSVVSTQRAAPVLLPKTRPFHMGFTGFPYDFTLQAQNETYDFIANHADLITFHQDSGVPWVEAAAGLPFHPNLVAEIDAEVAAIRPGQKVYVSATPQNTNRGGELADYRGSSTNLPLPAGWQNRTFDDPEVIAAYTQWCRYLIARFQPDYFAYAIECNGGFQNAYEHPFLEFVTLASQVYATLRAENPNLPIFITVQADTTNATREDFLELTGLELLWSDYVGISSYPFLDLDYGTIRTIGNPRRIAPDHLFSIAALAPGKPVAITETGYIAEDLDIPAYSIHGEGREVWQARYTNSLLWQAALLNAEFVVWFVPRDYDLGLARLAVYGIPIDPSFLIWRDNGLLDGAGRARQSLSVWDAWLSVRHHR